MKNRKKGLSIKDNDNFRTVELYREKVYIKDILSEKHTNHLDDERKRRFEIAVKLNQYIDGEPSEIDRVFLVDKGHKNGPELHCVTQKGIIFILNKRKYENHQHSFITVLLARPNQVIRLYEECGIRTPNSIIEKTKEYVEIGANNL